MDPHVPFAWSFRHQALAENSHFSEQTRNSSILRKIPLTPTFTHLARLLKRECLLLTRWIFFFQVLPVFRCKRCLEKTGPAADGGMYSKIKKNEKSTTDFFGFPQRTTYTKILASEMLDLLVVDGGLCALCDRVTRYHQYAGFKNFHVMYFSKCMYNCTCV